MPKDNLYSLTQTTQFRFKLYPKDFSKVRKFYEETLGYPVVESWDEENNRGVMFNTGLAIIELLTPKEGYVPVQGTGLSLQVADVWSLWEKMKDHSSILKPLNPKPSPWGDVGFHVTDPEGLEITFFTPEKLKNK